MSVDWPIPVYATLATKLQCATRNVTLAIFRAIKLREKNARDKIADATSVLVT